MRRKKQRELHELIICQDPIETERAFAWWRDKCAELFVPGTVLMVQNELCVDVARPGKIASADGYSFEPYIKNFLLFENGIRFTPSTQIAAIAVVVGSIQLDVVSDLDGQVPDPYVSKRRTKFFDLRSLMKERT